jgi:bifunctional DNA-binding transcriptional regulator/antitoxin component of YhaV-PrlF toxin-antitoxin module
MKATLRLDRSNRIVISRDLRRAAGISVGQKLTVSAAPGRIILELQAAPTGKIVKRGKLKVWTGAVPSTSLEEAVEQARRYSR